jgi:hypothetical protein
MDLSLVATGHSNGQHGVVKNRVAHLAQLGVKWEMDQETFIHEDLREVCIEWCKKFPRYEERDLNFKGILD